MKRYKVNEAFVWLCPNCNKPMEIIPFFDKIKKKKGVIVACSCGYDECYFKDNNNNDKELIPTFDKDGYPTEQTLNIISKWKDYSKEGLLKLFRFIQSCWQYKDMAMEKDGLFVFATGGWSGNESLLNALYSNFVVMSIVEYIKLVGGFIVIGVSEKAKELIREKRGEIVSFFWDYVRK